MFSLLIFPDKSNVLSLYSGENSMLLLRGSNWTKAQIEWGNFTSLKR